MTALLMLNILVLMGILGSIYVYIDARKTNKRENKYIRIDNKINVKIDEIKNMDGRDFEEFCVNLFKALGYKNTIITQATNDEGKDIILDNSIYVECKCWDEDKNNVGREILQKLIGAMIANNINKGICITTSYFNKNAFEYKNKIDKNTDIKLELYDMTDIKNILKSLT